MLAVYNTIQLCRTAANVTSFWRASQSNSSDCFGEFTETAAASGPSGGCMEYRSLYEDRTEVQYVRLACWESRCRPARESRSIGLPGVASGI